MATVTALQLQKHDKTRVSVFIDDAYAFSVGLEVAAGLQKGQQLSKAEIADLQQGGEQDRAYQKALQYLGTRPRSRAEVERYLHDKGFAEDIVAAALERLAAHNYLNDEEFAQFWLDNRTRFRPRSAAAVRHELRQKGVDKEAIDAALESLDEDEAAWAAAATKLDRWRSLERTDFDQKITAFLARRGFGHDIIRRVCRRAWDEIEQHNEETP